MTIEESDFRLTPDEGRYDLELLYTVKPRGGTEREEFKIAAYSISLEGAIKRIIHYRIEKNHKDDILSLKDFLNIYKSETEKLEKLCK